ncbi:MAG: copper resistance protein NlpE N-terminal domain-containing protein [Proteiniphilum sp.]|jgi:heat shock protein HslJ/uncharacterized lipoprotein NlpE involved in copper resistance|nr:copper resistance protein NlpE N-terminal domain-containing protein [Proteiniphilum sp.]
MKKRIVLLCIVVAALSACTAGKRSGSAPADGTSDMAGYNSRDSLDWAGVYKGILPCADCEGIQEEIRLNEDFSYEMVMTYLGKGDNRYSENGRIEWDEEGERFKLVSTASGSEGHWFRVSENRLNALDMEGNPIESSMPENYILSRIDLDNVVTEKYWKLAELNGKAIAPSENGDREAHFILHNSDSKISGNTGCNNLFGEYTLSGNSIKITIPMITRMACLGIDYEQEYLNALGACDGYSVLDDTLTLTAGETSLARFTAVYLR